MNAAFNLSDLDLFQLGIFGFVNVIHPWRIQKKISLYATFATRVSHVGSPWEVISEFTRMRNRRKEPES